MESSPENIKIEIEDTKITLEEKIPRLVFIVPYRDREQQYQFFKKHMQYVMEDYQPSDYRIFYIHQCDNREFNRGALKNLGFLITKFRYPNDYKKMTLVFNDIDTMPFTKNFLRYETQPGNVKHFYGFEYALGGIISINAADFEKINGFPNFWAWGYEDNLLNMRVKNAGLHIDRSQFFHLMDKNILQMKDGLVRSVNRKEFDRYIQETNEGIYSIQNIQYNVDDTTGFINVTNFNTPFNQNQTQNTIHDLRNGPAPFKTNEIKRKNAKKSTMKMVF
jgi:hypothetical protein